MAPSSVTTVTTILRIPADGGLEVQKDLMHPRPRQRVQKVQGSHRQLGQGDSAVK